MYATPLRVMIDPGELTLATFADCVGEAFRIRVTPGRSIDVTLAEAVALRDAPAAGGRAPFSIVFRASGEESLPQGIYAVEHETIGACEIFLVPLAPEAGAPRYEAVFT